MVANNAGTQWVRRMRPDKACLINKLRVNPDQNNPSADNIIPARNNAIGRRCQYGESANGIIPAATAMTNTTPSPLSQIEALNARIRNELELEGNAADANLSVKIYCMASAKRQGLPGHSYHHHHHPTPS